MQRQHAGWAMAAAVAFFSASCASTTPAPEAPDSAEAAEAADDAGSSAQSDAAPAETVTLGSEEELREKALKAYMATEMWAKRAVAACVSGEPFDEPSPSDDRVECEPPGEPGGLGTVSWVRPDGSVKTRGTFRDGEEHGVWREFLPDGVKVKEVHYKEGLMHGPYALWNIDTHALQIQGEYREDKEHGRWQVWHNSGEKRFELEFRDGKEHGAYQAWYEDGTPKEKGGYRDGKAHGPWTFWAESGTKSSEGEFQDGERDGEWTVWDGEGRVAMRLTFEKDEPVSAVPYRAGKKVGEAQRPTRKQCEGLAQHFASIDGGGGGEAAPPEYIEQIVFMCENLMTVDEMQCQMQATDKSGLLDCIPALLGLQPPPPK